MFFRRSHFSMRMCPGRHEVLTERIVSSTRQRVTYPRTTSHGALRVRTAPGVVGVFCRRVEEFFIQVEESRPERRLKTAELTHR